jgi:hypothetical protein
MKNVLPIVGTALVVALAIWYEVSMWNECRETNSFFYCMRVLGH